MFLYKLIELIMLMKMMIIFENVLNSPFYIVNQCLSRGNAQI